MIMKKIKLSRRLFALLAILAVGTGGCTADELTVTNESDGGQPLIVEEPIATGTTESEQPPAADEPTMIGDPENGKLLYELGPEGVYEKTCSSCHRLTDLVSNGPGFEGISERAANQVPGLSAEEYLRQSIVDPEAFIVEGEWEEAEAMPTIYGEAYSEKDINDLIAFLLTQ